MSASLLMEFNMTKGTNEDFQAVLHVLEEIGQQPIDKLWDLWIGNRSFTIENMFPNIWGDEWLNPDYEPYYLFAKAAPNAEWTASSDRLYEGDGTNGWDKASYSNGIMVYEVKEVYEEEPEEYRFLLRAYFTENKMPEDFKGIFLEDIIDD